MACIKVLDSSLVAKKNTYLAGSTISLADIIIYNELSMFFKLYNKNWTGPEMAEYPNLSKWASSKI